MRTPHHILTLAGTCALALVCVCAWMCLCAGMSSSASAATLNSTREFPSASNNNINDVSLANNASYATPSTIPLAATATPAAGTTITRIEVYSGTALISTSNGGTLNTTWITLKPGTQTLTARAIDSNGGISTASVTITVTSAANETITFIHNDLAGSPMAATDINGAIVWKVVWKEDYSPYGERKQNEAAASNQHQWFGGKVQDSETGLSYFGARYYDPVVGRFMGVDAVGFNPGNLQSFNRYAYANNNPYRFVDLDGNSGQEVLDWLAGRPAWFVGIPGRVYDRWNDPSQRLPNGPENAANAALAIAGGMAAGNALKGEIAAEAPAVNITAPYARPNGATTAEQRASVQGKPCVDCAATTPRQVADHKEPLVKEYYRTGTIDKEKMKSVDAVQPQCPTCSAKQGAEMSKFSKEKKDEYGFK